MIHHTRVAIVLVALSVVDCVASRTASVASMTADLPSEGEAAVLFAPGVVSTGDVFASTFTPDGRTVVFTKLSAPRMWLMSSTFADGAWQQPIRLPFSGSYRDLDPSFSPDGSRLYFSSWRPKEASDTASLADTWYVERRGTDWSAPVRLAEPANGPEVDMYPSVTRGGALYFDSFRSRPRKRLIYRVALNPEGQPGEPLALPPAVNADSGASNAFVDPDDRYIVFAANRPEGRGGVDLYLSWHAGADWSAPRNLGPLVNTPDTEFCPFVSSNGTYLYFTRITTSSAGQVQRNIYVVRFDRLRELLR